MSSLAGLDPEPSTSAWRAELDLEFEQRNERTVVVHRRHQGPILVQSAFYPEGAPCHVYLLHPPGGIVGGDALQMRIKLTCASHALLTTPASGKFYRSRVPGEAGPLSSLSQHIQVDAQCTLEWLPCESIVFDGANCASQTRFHLHREAKLLAWEGWIFGRPAIDEQFSNGIFNQDFEVFIDERPILIDRNRVLAGSDWMRQAWGMAGACAVATLVAYPGGELALRTAREACLDASVALTACTEVDGLLVCRVTANRLPTLRRQMEQWWKALRPVVVGCEATTPRIWAT